MPVNSTWLGSRIQFSSVSHHTDHRYRSSSPPSPISASQFFGMSFHAPHPDFDFRHWTLDFGLSHPSPFQLSAFRHFPLCVSALLHEAEVIHATLFVAGNELPTTRTASVPTPGLTRLRRLKAEELFSEVNTCDREEEEGKDRSDEPAVPILAGGILASGKDAERLPTG